ncbi:MAG TPA: hypothetical protein VGN32_06690 [Ktedonobacterales bacterium]|nr:hypothetical protein [Ktedonobacterales bacterium]
MPTATEWRLALGQRIGMAYAANPKAAVVMVAGSTGRGTADRYSDLEIDVYWAEPPTDDERRAAAEGGGGTLLDLAPYEEDEWAETIDFGGFHIGTSTFLVATMEEYLRAVLDRASIDPLAQMRLSSVLRARTVVGTELVRRWRARAAAYPTALAHAMLAANLEFEGFGYDEDMLAARDDLLRLYDVFCRVERQLLGALLGLNRRYLPNPGFKHMDELIAEFQFAPPNLSSRLKGTFHVPPPEGVRQLHALCEETLDLVAQDLPDFDTTRFRTHLRQRRGAWDAAPPQA